VTDRLGERVTRSPSPSVLLTKDSTRTEIMKLIALSMAFGAVAIGTGLAACSSVHQPAPISSNAPGSSKSAASLQVHIPDALKVPSGNTLAGSFEAYGQQIYQCTNNSWTLLQPAALISDHGNPSRCIPKARCGFRRSTVVRSARHRCLTPW
jgi:hypothetical protein